MITNQNIQGSSSLDEAAILKIIDTIQSHLNLFYKQINNDMKVLILVGITGSGKSTIFNLLCGAKFKLIENEDGVEELELDEISQEFSVMKGGMQSVTKEPKYYFNEEFNHLLIDFPGFQDTNGELDQIMIQMLFYKISTMSKVKILYVVRHPELQFQDRGQDLQEFIRATFNEQSIGIENLTLVLNAFNEENFSDEDVKKYVTESINQLYHNPNQSLNIIVLRKVNEQDDIVKQLSEENRRKFWEEIIKSKEITLKPIQILHIEKISAYLSEKSFKFIQDVWISIQLKLTENLEKAQQNDISKLQNLGSMFQELPKITNTNFEQIFQKFEIALANIAQQLGSLEEVKQKREEFLKIYVFFSQFSDLINGYSECQKHSNFASNLQQYFIQIINNKIDFLKEKQKVEKTTAEKDQEIQLKNNAMSRAEQQRQFKEQCISQQRQLKSETDQLLQSISQQKNEKAALENNLAQIRNDYNNLKQKSEQTQRDFDNKIWQEQNKKTQLLSSIENIQSEIRNQSTLMVNQLQKIQNELEEQEKKQNLVKSKLQDLRNTKYKLESNLSSLERENSQIAQLINQKAQQIRDLKYKIEDLSHRRRRHNKCQIF